MKQNRFLMAKNAKKYLLKLFPSKLKKIIKQRINYQESKFNKFKSIPRYQETTFLLAGKEIIIPDNASYLFMYKEIFEEEIYKFKTSNHEPLIIDGGANIGLATIYFKDLFPNAKIIAFEPDPDIFKILKNNIQVFNLSNIQLIQKGLWDSNTRLNFWSEGADAGLITDLDKSRSSQIEIETISLKEYLDRRVDFLKLDIEGAETLVLKDIDKYLDIVDRIFVEYHSFVGQRQTLNEIIDILTKANFRLHISSPGLTSSTPFIHLNVYNNMDMQLNIYGIKEEAN